jgi:hypothetical protein
VSHDHHSEIEVLTPTTATGLWYLNVFINLREARDDGQRHRDEYVKQFDGWRIKSSTYHRLYEIRGRSNPRLLPRTISPTPRAAGARKGGLMR